MKVFSIFLLLFLALSSSSLWAQNCFKGDEVAIKGDPQGYQIHEGKGMRWIWAQDRLLTQNAEFKKMCPDAKLIPQNPKRIIVLSSTYLPWLEDLSLTENIVGVSSKSYVASPKIHQLISEGKVAEVGFPASSEKVLSLRPDLVITYRPVDEEIEGVNKLKSLGLNILELHEFDESNPLARGSWLLYLATLLGDQKQYERATKVWNERVLNYQNYQKSAASFSQVKVLIGHIGENAWSAPAITSDLVQMVEDARGSFDTSVGQNISFEKVLQNFSDAKIWLTQNQWTSKDQIEKEDARYKLIPAYQSGFAYNYAKNKRAQAGFDYWETGVARPDLALLDLILIFHPTEAAQSKVFKNRETQWYQKLE